MKKATFVLGRDLPLVAVVFAFILIGGNQMTKYAPKKGETFKVLHQCGDAAVIEGEGAEFLRGWPNVSVAEIVEAFAQGAAIKDLSARWGMGRLEIEEALRWELVKRHEHK